MSGALGKPKLNVIITHVLKRLCLCIHAKDENVLQIFILKLAKVTFRK